MTKRSSKNSILFVTTLGVYLGLVLTGGVAPQVFAHGALTRNFEISEEIEIKDDLDKKPDPKKQLSEYAAALVRFYQESGDPTKRDPARFRSAPSSLDFGLIADHSVGFIVKDDVTRIDRSVEEFALKLYALFPHFSGWRKGENGVSKAHIWVNYELTDVNLSLKTTCNQNSVEAASAVSAVYADGLLSLRQTAGRPASDLILNNTSIITANDQIFVVTNLARASLDLLLAKNAQ